MRERIKKISEDLNVLAGFVDKAKATEKTMSKIYEMVSDIGVLVDEFKEDVYTIAEIVGD